MRRICLAMLCALLALPASAQAVVGGRDATRPYPYMVALEYDDAESPSRYDTICGASLIDGDRVLTAAHCVVDDRDGDASDDPPQPVPPSSLRVLVGTQKLSDRSAGQTIGVAEVIVHERYLGDELGGHDVAILRLAAPATKGEPIRIASPASEKPLWAPGEIATVTGWGTAIFLDPGVAYQDQLQEVQVPMRSDDECRRNYLGGIDPATMVCAGELHGGRDSCQGDSGGPLVVPDAAGELVQAGVVSFGNGCGFPTQYGVYARIADTVLYDWIRARVPVAAAPPPGGTPSTGSGGSGGSGGGSAGGSGSTSAQPSGSSKRPRKYKRCMVRASRKKGITARRRAQRRCWYAKKRRVAYRRCLRKGKPKQKCKAKRRAAKRRHERKIARTR